MRCNRKTVSTDADESGWAADRPARVQLGAGLTVRPGVTAGGGVPAPSVSAEGEFQPSLDVTQRLGSNVLASATVNTDIAETEVDTRRTNLTRFPLFFPEKRTFFLEGDDIFSFGLGLEEDILPYFSRRIGLVNDREVPIIAGGKVNGRIANTNFGGLVVGTNDEPGARRFESALRTTCESWESSFTWARWSPAWTSRASIRTRPTRG
jgi:hypothetical protein